MMVNSCEMALIMPSVFVLCVCLLKKKKQLLLDTK